MNYHSLLITAKMITERQEKILNSLIKEYINLAEPISSELLNKKCNLNISPATIRNELQVLAEKGYIEQPHTSSGRIPTDKAYRYFVDKLFSDSESFLPDFISKEVEIARQKIEKELKMAQELTKSLEEISLVLDFKKIEEDMLFDVLRIIGPSRTTYKKNIDVIRELLDEFDEF